MGRQAPPLPPWSWKDLETTLQAMADSPDQQRLLSHFLTALKQNPPTDPSEVLSEAIYIAMSIARLDDASPGTDPRPERRLLV